MPNPTESQQVLLEMGSKLVTLASQAFPSGTTIEDEDLGEAAKKTAAILKEGKPAVIFNGAFQGGGTEVRCDIILTAPGGELDVFEVKAGTSVKPRHIADVALQVHAIEACDWKVHNAAILHLNPRYKHDGGKNYPVQKLFKNVDITARVRRQLPRLADTIAEFQGSMEDEGTLELPTGTWCKAPLPCIYMDSCISEGPSHPLVSLPQLSKEQETALHESGIEEIEKIDAEMDSLTALQKRAIKSVQENKLVIESMVPEELQDVDFPLHFVHIQWFLEVLPRFDLSYPWQHIPAMWSCHVLSEDGKLDHSEFTFDEAEDPRTKCVESLARVLNDDGTLIVYAGTFEERLRTMLEDFPELKPKLRSLMHMPLLDMGQLIRHGVYHPDFKGKFDQHTVHSCLSDQG
ncbi:MAG: DUF2779 domain-containing protein, partial [Planctomycetota bacterium]